MKVVFWNQQHNYPFLLGFLGVVGLLPTRLCGADRSIDVKGPNTLDPADHRTSGNNLVVDPAEFAKTRPPIVPVQESSFPQKPEETDPSLWFQEVAKDDYQLWGNTNEGLAASPLRSRVTEQRNHRELVESPFSSTPEDNISGATCADQTTCQTCVTKSSWCHWCDKQNECHSRGSFYGCFSGVTQCAAHKNDTVDPNDQHGCASHQTCGECATASRFCHWCGHDQACHAIGSVYGCTVGVDCFSNDRCKRSEPERIHTRVSMDDLSPLPLIIVTSIALIVCCCASVCFWICSGVKGAYDDLVVSANPGGQPDGGLEDPLLDQEDDQTDEGDDQPEAVENEHADEHEQARREDEAEHFQDALDHDESADAPLNDEEDPVEQLDESSLENETDPLLEPNTTSLMRPSRRRSIRPRRPRHMQRLYNACTGCYALTMVMMLTMVVCSVIYYPQMPIYNICNDDVAWKSIIDNMARMHTEADFEILASLSNPNHISVALDNGTGFFHHNGKVAGSFIIPPFTAQAMSITDILIIAHLTPGTWDAVQIAKEYSMGKLILHVNTSVVIRVPSLADFTYAGQMDDIVVNVNEINDRSLCACPSWDDARNHTGGTLFMESDDRDLFAFELPAIQET